MIKTDCEIERHAEVLSKEASSLPPLQRPPPSPSIRQRLQEWNLDYASSRVLNSESLEISEPGEVLNNLTRTNDGGFQLELDMDDADDAAPLMVYDELVDVGNKRGFLLRGDLVELRYLSMQSFFLLLYPSFSKILIHT
jgi:hypothetical protein